MFSYFFKAVSAVNKGPKSQAIKILYGIASKQKQGYHPENKNIWTDNIHNVVMLTMILAGAMAETINFSVYQRQSQKTQAKILQIIIEALSNASLKYDTQQITYQKCSMPNEYMGLCYYDPIVESKSGVTTSLLTHYVSGEVDQLEAIAIYFPEELFCSKDLLKQHIAEAIASTDYKFVLDGKRYRVESLLSLSNSKQQRVDLISAM